MKRNVNPSSLTPSKKRKAENDALSKKQPRIDSLVEKLSCVKISSKKSKNDEFLSNIDSIGAKLEKCVLSEQDEMACDATAADDRESIGVTGADDIAQVDFKLSSNPPIEPTDVPALNVTEESEAPGHAFPGDSGS